LLHILLESTFLDWFKLPLLYFPKLLILLKFKHSIKMMLSQVMLALTVVLGLASALVKSYHSILFFKLILINVLVTLGEALSITSMVPKDLAARQTQTTQLL
jgi:hypothetical protein